MNVTLLPEYPIPGGFRRWMRAHPRAVSAILVSAYLLFNLFGLIFSSVESNGLIMLILMAVVSAALWFRHRNRLVMFLITCAGEALLALLSGSSTGGPALLFFWPYILANAYGFLRAILLVTPAVLGFTYVFYFLSEFDGMSLEDSLRAEFPNEQQEVMGMIVALFVINFLTAAIITIIGSVIRRNRMWEAEMRKWAEELRHYGRVQERNQIAREMHDVVAHSLSVMISLSDGARCAIDRDPEQAKEVLSHATGTGRTALADMRRMIGVLRSGDSAELVPQPSADILPELFENFRRAGLPVVFVSSGPPLPDSKSLQMTIYRIIQESLTNALRYAHGATKVEVELANRGDYLRIRVTDNGFPNGKPESMGAGQGLAGIRERAQLYSGSVEAGPLKGRGWQVLVQLPLTDINLEQQENHV